MKVIPLGTNGFFPSYGRETACYAVPLGKTLIILDSGTGLFRLGEDGSKKLLAGATDVHLYLSHLHLDHTFGFYAAFKLLEEKKVTVFAKDSFKVFSDLSKDYFPTDYNSAHRNFTWEKLKSGKNKIGDYSVTVRNQYHNGAGSLAFRFNFPARNASASVAGGGLAYVTDSEPSLESIEFVRGAKLLLHEHYLSGEEILTKKNPKIKDYFSGKHVTSVGAAVIAKKAEVGKLALIHHYPFYDNRKLEKLLSVARQIFSETTLAQDAKPVEF